MFALYFIGRDVEAILGQRHFLYLYLAGIRWRVNWVIFSSCRRTTVLLAASGGVAAVIVAFAHDPARVRVGRFALSFSCRSN